MGKNGAGKSTLLDIIAGLRTPDSGGDPLSGRDVCEVARKGAIKAHRPSAARNKERVAVHGRAGRSDGTLRICGSLVRIGRGSRLCADAMRAWIVSIPGIVCYRRLSGGEQQRVLLAACIAQCPANHAVRRAIHLSRHSSADPLFHDVGRNSRAKGRLCIAVTHDLNLAFSHCTRVLVLDQGKLAADLGPSTTLPMTRMAFAAFAAIKNVANSRRKAMGALSMIARAARCFRGMGWIGRIGCGVPARCVSASLDRKRLDQHGSACSRRRRRTIRSSSNSACREHCWGFSPAAPFH